MLINHTPLRIASGVLAATTIDSVRRSTSYHACSWQILDRWAFNSPEQLRALEVQGELLLLGRLLEQQIVSSTRHSFRPTDWPNAGKGWRIMMFLRCGVSLPNCEPSM